VSHAPGTIRSPGGRCAPPAHRRAVPELRPVLAFYGQFIALDAAARHVLAWNAVVDAGFSDMPFEAYPDIGGNKALRGCVKRQYTGVAPLQRRRPALRVIPERRMNGRLDIAWGKDVRNFYFSVGEAFRPLDRARHRRRSPTSPRMPSIPTRPHV
jgi:hypothetical protein